MNIRSNQHGTSLVELLIALSVGVALMGVLSPFVSRVIATSANAGDHLQDAVTIARLAEQFRRDAHACAGPIELGTVENESLTLRLDDATIVAYSRSSDGLRRTLTVAGNTKQSETFVLNGIKLSAWNWNSSTRAVTLQLIRIAPGTQEGQTSGRQFRIVAVAGRDRALGESP